MRKFQVEEIATGFVLSHPLRGMSSTLFDSENDAVVFMRDKGLTETYYRIKPVEVTEKQK